MAEANKFFNLGLLTGGNLQDIIGKMMYEEVTSKEFTDKVLRAIHQELKKDGHFADAAIEIDTSSGNLTYVIVFTARDESLLVMRVVTKVIKGDG